MFELATRCFLLCLLLTSATFAQLGPEPPGRGIAECAFASGFDAPVPDDWAEASVVFDDGTGSALFVGGHFEMIDGVEANHVAKWDGTSWSPLGTGLDDTVLDLVGYDDGTGPALYVVGFFEQAGGMPAEWIAKWDGTQWSSLPSTGLDAINRAARVFVYDDGNGDELYVAGSFEITGKQEYVAKWDGAQWTATGLDFSLSVFDGPLDFAVFDDGTGTALYAVGSFIGDGGTTPLAKWDGKEWTPVSLGLVGQGHGLAVFNDGSGDALYLAGYFRQQMGDPSLPMIKWDGTSGTLLGAGYTGGSGTALTTFDDGSGIALYLMGDFSQVGGVSASGLAKWDGTAWTFLQTGITPREEVGDLTVFDDGSGPALYVGGAFPRAGNSGASYVARWNGGWSRVSSPEPHHGLNGGVFSFATWDDGNGPALYAGGGFTNPGLTGSRNLGRWDGTSWQGLGAATNGPVNALAVYDDGGGSALYAGGQFNRANGVVVGNIARWTGTEWQALADGGTNGFIYALAVFDDGGGPALFAAGDFSFAGSAAAISVAKWDGTAWSSTGFVGSESRSLAVWDDGGGPALYAGGPDRVYRYDGGSWSDFGSTFAGTPRSLAVYGGTLYVGGDLESPGGGVSKWDGGDWVRLSNFNGTVYSIAAHDDGSGSKLYVTGNFQVIAPQVLLPEGPGPQDRVGSPNGLARWDDSQWESVLGGLTGYSGNGQLGGGRVLGAFSAVGAPNLMVGGYFSRAGGVVSNRIAEYSCIDADVFGDDFELGTTDAWSTTVP